jgi:predicted O-methyltransferase YrrM
MDLLRPLEIYAAMRAIGGWFTDEEGDLLLSAALAAIGPERGAERGAAGEARTLVEVGSYLGRSTAVLGRVVRALSPRSRVFAIDPHEGVVGADGEWLHHGSETLTQFRRNMAEAGVAEVVEPVVAKSFEVAWDRPIHLLFVDGLHDYDNVARDFRHFERFVAAEGVVLFHDYADYYPGVMRFVDELVAGGGWHAVAQAGSLRLLGRA